MSVELVHNTLIKFSCKNRSGGCNKIVPELCRPGYKPSDMRGSMQFSTLSDLSGCAAQSYRKAFMAMT